MATDVAPAPTDGPVLVIVFACVGLVNVFALFVVLDVEVVACVEKDVACAGEVVTVGDDAAAALDRLAPCTLKADKKEPKNDLFVGLAILL